MFGITPYNRRNAGISRQKDVFDVFDNFFNEPFFGGFFSSVSPIRADIRESDTEYVIEAEIPGVRKEDIKLDLRDDTLTISVENNMETNEERDNYIRKERRYGSCSRSFYLENVKREAASAKYNNGILTINLPKNETPDHKRHSIDIQ
jgi:HSP20 family protein